MCKDLLYKDFYYVIVLFSSNYFNLIKNEVIKKNLIVYLKLKHNPNMCKNLIQTLQI